MNKLQFCDFAGFATMSSTSQKHRNFVAEPMGDKLVTDLAGVGEVLGKRLETQGFDKVYPLEHRFVTQYITYLNIWGVLLKALSTLSIHDPMVLVWNSCRS
jgi:Barrier to autointegration factor.